MRDLLVAVEETDLIVMVSVQPPSVLARRNNLCFHASTRLLGKAGGQRYVAIWIDAQWHRRPLLQRRIALLAHELQHALEIAAAPDVVDQDAMSRFFSRIGYELSPWLFETDAALAVESRVAAELKAAHTSPLAR